MASFIKDLLAKHKEKKYGKGHRLGDTPTETYSNSVPQAQTPRPTTSSQSEAARRAGEAALQRLQNNNKPTPRPISSIPKSSEKDMEKALSIKEHYFGKQEVVDNISTASKIKIYFKSSVFQPGERYTLDQVEDKIEECLLQNLEIEPLLVSISLLYTANYKNREKLDKCVEIINKFVDNILNNPNEEKFRKIRLENPTFKEKVYSCKYADMVFKKAGFLAKTIRLDDKDDDVFIFEGNDFEKLENFKSALQIVEPVLPELDRDIKVFKISDSNSSSLNDFSLSDDFFNLKIEELRKEQALRNEAIEKAGMLRTKAMREKDEQMELRRYNYSLIRIKFPDNFILQALFKSNEKYDVLYNLVENSLNFDNIPFELVSHSLKKPNGSCMGMTLAEIGLAPSALVYFKINEIVDQSTKSKIKHFLKPDLYDLAVNF